MPLKTDDLKTVETYKKAMKLDANKIGASGNTKFWVYKDVELPTASGGKQKLPALLALVDDTAVKQVMKGKPPFCRGVCGLKEGKISFDPTQGKVPYALLTKSVPLLLGKMVHIPSDADPDAEGEEGAPEIKAEIKAPEIKGRYAQLNASWKQLSQQAAERIAANPTMRAALTKAMTGIPEMLQGGKLGEAEKQIQQLEAALKIPDAPPPAGGPGRYAQLNASWKQFSQLAAQKIAEDPAQKAELTKAMAGIPEMLQGGQLGEAQKRIEQLGAVLKVPATPPPQAPPPGPPGGQATGRYAQLNASWKQLSQQAAERIAANPTMRAALTKAMTGIPEMLQGGKLGEAEKQIQQLEAALKIPDAPPPPPPPPPGGPGRYAQLNASWKQFQQLAAQKIAEDPAQKAELTKAMAGIAEMLQGGQLGEAQKRIEQLGAILKVPATPPPTPPPPPGGESTGRYAKLNDTWKQLSQQVTQRMAANPAQREFLTKAMAGIPEMLQGGQLGEAQRRIEQLDAALKIPPPPPPPPPTPPPPPGAAPGNKSAQLNATWKQLSQQATQRMTANPAQREYLTKATAGIAQLLESGNLAEAQKRIDRLQEALKLAPDALPPEAEAQAAAWKKLEVRVKQAIDKHPQHKAELVRATAGLAEMIRVGKTQLAGQLMTTVTAALKRIQKEEEAALPIEQRTARLTKTWKAISGDMQRTIARYPDMREELAPVGAAVDRAIQAGKLDEADKRIDEVATMIEGLGDAQLRFENEYAEVEDVIASHAKGDSEEANKIRLARGVMQDRVEAGDFDAAFQMMERVMALIPGGPEL